MMARSAPGALLMLALIAGCSRTPSTAEMHAWDADIQRLEGEDRHRLGKRIDRSANPYAGRKGAGARARARTSPHTSVS